MACRCHSHTSGENWDLTNITTQKTRKIASRALREGGITAGWIGPSICVVHHSTRQTLATGNFFSTTNTVVIMWQMRPLKGGLVPIESHAIRIIRCIICNFINMIYNRVSGGSLELSGKGIVLLLYKLIQVWMVIYCLRYLYLLAQTSTLFLCLKTNGTTKQGFSKQTCTKRTLSRYQ